MIAFLSYKMILVLVIFTITLAVAAYSTYAERKVAAFLQDRIGPDRAGPFGLLQPLAEWACTIWSDSVLKKRSNLSLRISGVSSNGKCDREDHENQYHFV